MAANCRRTRTELAQAYAALAHESEERGEYGRAADLYRTALLVLYNTPVPMLRHDRGVPENDTETRMPSDPTVQLDVGEQTGAENSVRSETASGHT